MTDIKRPVDELTYAGDAEEGDFIVGEKVSGTTVRMTFPAVGGGTPGGSDTQLQYNNSGSFGGISQMTYNGTNVSLTTGFTIDGTADEIQLKVQGHSSQTANIFEIENSSAADLFTIDNSGNVTVNGTVDGRDLATDGTKLDGIESAATADQTEEEIQDLAWTNVLGGTQTLITVIYQDSTNDVDFVVDNDLANYSNTNSAFITAASTDTLTNKTFDANGTGNSLSNVDVADLANGTDGELITWDASGNPATVSVGTSGHVLTSNGVGAAPTFQAAAGGGDLDWELISTATASNDASINFTGLSSTYAAYKIIIARVTPATDNVFFRMRTSTDNGSSYDAGASDYAHVKFGGQMSTSATSFIKGDDADVGIELLANAGSDTNEDGALEVILYGHSIATHTAVTWVSSFKLHSAGGPGFALNGSGYRLSAADVDAIQFLYSSGNVESGEFYLYGLRAS